MGSHRRHRRFWRMVRTGTSYFFIALMAISIFYLAMSAWSPSTPGPAEETATASPATAPEETQADGENPEAGWTEVWHCEKCGKNWPAFRICCWQGTTRVR